ncbi:DUF1801 domain-containing protein [Flavisolibacter sp. BT320]|nr:DUF1801 domain-containing protein [Flavisolibacter longurius]
MMENDVTKYIATVGAGEQKALRSLRQQILQLLPGAEERLSRGVPFFYYCGKRAVGFRASKHHLSFFIMEGNVLNELRKEMADFNNASTVVRFTADKPLPESLIEKLVWARMKEIDRKLGSKSLKPNSSNGIKKSPEL